MYAPVVDVSKLGTWQDGTYELGVLPDAMQTTFLASLGPTVVLAAEELGSRTALFDEVRMEFVPVEQPPHYTRHRGESFIIPLVSVAPKCFSLL